MSADLGLIGDTIDEDFKEGFAVRLALWGVLTNALLHALPPGVLASAFKEITDNL
jgi:hypothetical protein